MTVEWGTRQHAYSFEFWGSQWCWGFKYSRVRHSVVGWVFPDDILQALQAVGCRIPWNKIQQLCLLLTKGRSRILTTFHHNVRCLLTEVWGLRWNCMVQHKFFWKNLVGRLEGILTNQNWGRRKGGRACTEPVGDKEVKAQPLSWPTVEICKWTDVND